MKKMKKGVNDRLDKYLNSIFDVTVAADGMVLNKQRYINWYLSMDK